MLSVTCINHFYYIPGFTDMRCKNSRVLSIIREQLRREPSWGELKTVPEKVRALYRRAVYKAYSQGFHHKDTYTPSEEIAGLSGYVKTDAPTLDALRDYYEEVRYGNHVPEAGAVEQINKKI